VLTLHHLSQQTQFHLTQAFNWNLTPITPTDKLALLLQRPVEVIPEHELNRHIREQVLREVVDL